MPLTLVSSMQLAVRSWIQSRLPRRESFIIGGALMLIFGASYLAAFYVRSELLLRSTDAETIVRTIWWVVLCKFVIFYTRGICHRPLRAIRFEDLSVLVRATTTALLVFVAVNFYMPKFVPGWIQIPRAVVLLDWAFTLLAVGGLQATARSIYEEIMPGNALGQRRTALVIDASPESRRVAEKLSSRDGGDYVISGILDDDVEHYGKHVAGTRVIGVVASAAACAQRLRVSDVIVHRGSLYGGRLKHLCRECTAIRVRVGIAEEAPAEGAEPADGTPAPSGVVVRPVEIRDLLNHPEARLESSAATLRGAFGGATVLVTGAGGSIGAELCRQLLLLGPRRIVAVDRGELPLARLLDDLRPEAGGAGPQIEGILADVQDAARLGAILRTERPAIVIHAAAYGNAALLEAHPAAAAENNVLAPADLADLAVRHGVGRFVVISSRVPEGPGGIRATAARALERHLGTIEAPPRTALVVVRLGEVVDAAGGLVPAISRLLRAGRPVEIPGVGQAAHMVTLREAARLVLLAAASADGSQTFDVDSGPPMRVAELADTLVYLLRLPTAEAAPTLPPPAAPPDGARREEASMLVRATAPSAAQRPPGGALEALRDAVRDGDRAAVVAALSAMAGTGAGGESA